MPPSDTIPENSTTTVSDIINIPKEDDNGSSVYSVHQKLPDELIGQEVAQFLDRRTMNHLGLSKRGIQHIIRTSVTPPWPAHVRLPHSKQDMFHRVQEVAVSPNGEGTAELGRF